MKHKRNKQNLSLSGDDVQAILCALPLVLDLGAETTPQQMANKMLCESAVKKLISQKTDFTSNELRVVAAASLCASEYLAGHLPDLLLDDTLDADLKKYFFTYNRLNSYFRPMLEILDNQ